ncbi:helix-turn-helix domain-containing protein [Micromonospora sp. NPDC002389]|uniref:TetR/AcrR family transcriptional regulator n=1 Tax=Micromonospora sp. NPDC002389 TaxID=3154272 RepID=UPI00332DCDDB
MYAPEDRTAKAIIRDTALELFGEQWPTAASLKQVAERAGVSQSLIIKHYGSREGLVAAVDAHVLGVLGNALEALAETAGSGPPDGFLASADALSSPAATRYLAHLLVGTTSRSVEAYRMLQGFADSLMNRMADAGAVARDVDRAQLAVVLLAHELSIILLRDRITDVLGTDPMGRDGLRRWWDTIDRLYSGTAIQDPVPADG